MNRFSKESHPVFSLGINGSVFIHLVFAATLHNITTMNNENRPYYYVFFIYLDMKKWDIEILSNVFEDTKIVIRQDGISTCMCLI